MRRIAPFVLFFSVLLFPRTAFSFGEPAVHVAGDEKAAGIARHLAPLLPGRRVTVDSVPGRTTLGIPVKLSGNVEAVIVVSGRWDQRGVMTDGWKMAVARRLWTLDDAARRRGAKLIVMAPDSSPDARRQKSLDRQSRWLAVACAAKGIPFVRGSSVLDSPRGEWSGFAGGVRVRSDDGEGLTEAGLDLEARLLVAEITSAPGR